MIEKLDGSNDKILNSHKWTTSIIVPVKMKQVKTYTDQCL